MNYFRSDCLEQQSRSAEANCRSQYVVDVENQLVPNPLHKLPNDESDTTDRRAQQKTDASCPKVHRQILVCPDAQNHEDNGYGGGKIWEHTEQILPRLSDDQTSCPQPMP